MPTDPAMPATCSVPREGLSVHPRDHTALGGCEPGALVGQAFPSPGGVWTKTYKQRDRAPLTRPTHGGCCDGRASKSCKRPTMLSRAAPLPGKLSQAKGPVLLQARAAFPAFTYLSRAPDASASKIRFLLSFLPSP